MRGRVPRIGGARVQPTRSAAILMKTNSFLCSRSLALAAVAALGLGAVAARGATFTGGMLTLNDATSTGSGPANPYPSTINVSGLQTIAATGNCPPS